MNAYAVSASCALVTLVLISLVAFFKAVDRRIGNFFVFLNIIIIFWVVGCLIQSTTNSGRIAVWADMLLYTGAALAPAAYLHLILVVTKEEARKRIGLALAYLGSGIILLFNLTPFLRPYFVKDVAKIYDFRFVSVPALGWYFYVLFYSCIVVYMLSVLYRAYQLSVGPRKEQLKYFFLSSFILVMGGATYCALVIGWLNIPVDNVFTITYSFVTAYAIIKHRLLDIRVAVTRAGIFMIVYLLVLGVPFWIGSRVQSWVIPTVLAVVLASAGPFIYNYLRREAEERILREQHRYQRALRDLARELVPLHETDRLLSMITDKTYEIIRAEFTGMYVLNGRCDEFELLFCEPAEGYPLSRGIPADASFVLAMNLVSAPVASSELAVGRAAPHEIFLLPLKRRGDLCAFLALGPKRNRTGYDESDIQLFEILISSASLALENCQSWEEQTELMAREDQLRRVSAMDHYSSALSHEIVNALQAPQSGLSALRMIVADPAFKEKLDDDLQNTLRSMIERSVGGVERVLKMVVAIRKFSGKNKEEFERLDLASVIEESLLLLPQFNVDSIQVETRHETGLFVRGNKIMLQQVLFNLGSNAVHALQCRDKKDRRIWIDAFRKDPRTVQLMFSDNGEGIKKWPGHAGDKDFLEHIFLDFTTTKPSTIGTGMGLSHCRKIVESHGGRIRAESEGENKGMTFIIELPLEGTEDDRKKDSYCR
jgi:signal transduction histidine kinase